jgi:hypothetical protein
MAMRYRDPRLVLSLLVAACTAGCGSALEPGGRDRSQVQSSTYPPAHTACFYSDRSGADRLASDRVIHWCGPEPRAVF